MSSPSKSYHFDPLIQRLADPSAGMPCDLSHAEYNAHDVVAAAVDLKSRAAAAQELRDHIDSISHTELGVFAAQVVPIAEAIFHTIPVCFNADAPEQARSIR
jgi:hypothetical protein